MSEVTVAKCDGRLGISALLGEERKCGRLMEVGQGVEIHGAIHILGQGGVIGPSEPGKPIHLCPRCFKSLFKGVPEMEWVNTR